MWNMDSWSTGWCLFSRWPVRVISCSDRPRAWMNASSMTAPLLMQPQYSPGSGHSATGGSGPPALDGPGARGSGVRGGAARAVVGARARGAQAQVGPDLVGGVRAGARGTLHPAL